MDYVIGMPLWLFVALCLMPGMMLLIKWIGAPRLSLEMARETMEHFKDNRLSIEGGWYRCDTGSHTRSYIHHEYGKVVFQPGKIICVTRPGYAGQVSYFDGLGERIVYTSGMGIRLGILRRREKELTRHVARELLDTRYA